MTTTTFSEACDQAVAVIQNHHERGTHDRYGCIVECLTEAGRVGVLNELVSSGRVVEKLRQGLWRLTPGRS
jgi:hypothetical protein